MAICPTCRKHFPDSESTCPHDGSTLLPDATVKSLDLDLEAGQMVGEYAIEAKLGEGTFGTVYRARHPVIGKGAAIKILKRELCSSPQMVSRFVEEARAVNRIEHPGIIDIFAFGTLDDGRHYFVMELLKGMELSEYLRLNAPVPPATALPILQRVARALEAAHQAGIVHRDLKPDNLFMMDDGDGGFIPKLLDFGIAKLLDDSARGHKTRTGTPMGTPIYMSPEQCRGTGVSHRTDIYSFGVLVHETLTGKQPFSGESTAELMMQHLAAEPPRMSEVYISLPPQLDEPVLRMLAKQPEERPETISRAMAELLEAARSAGVEVALPPALAATAGAQPTAPAAGLAQPGPTEWGDANVATCWPEPGSEPLPAHSSAAAPGSAGSGATSPGARAQVSPAAAAPGLAGAPAATAPPIPATVARGPAYQAGAGAAQTTPSAAEPPAGPRGGASAGPPSKTPLLVIAVLLALVVGGGGVLALLTLGDSAETASAEAAATAVSSATSGSGTPAAAPPASASAATPASASASAKPPDDGLRLTCKAPVKGAVVTASSVLEGELETIQQGKLTYKESERARLSVLAAGDRLVTKAEVELLDSSKTMTQGSAPPQIDRSPLIGRRFIVESTGAELLVSDPSGGNLSEADEEEVIDAVMSWFERDELSKLLSSRSFKQGDRVTLDDGFVEDLFGYDDELKSIDKKDLIFRALAANSVEPRASFDLELGFTMEAEGGIVAVELSGHTVLQVDTCWPLSIHLEGPMKPTMMEGIKQDGAHKMTITQSYIYEIPKQ